MAKEKGIELNPAFLKPELYGYQIPPHLITNLNLPAPGDKTKRKSVD